MKHPATGLCPHFGACSGCTEVLSVKPPTAWEEVLLFFKDQILPNLHQNSPFGWRHRAKIAVRGTPGAPLIGLFKRASHVVSPYSLLPSTSSTPQPSFRTYQAVDEAA